MQSRHRQSGISLIEIAVVVLVVSVIAAGMLGGGVLLRNAQVQSVYADFKKYRDMVYAFDNVYGSLPGDISWESAPFSAPSGTTLYAGNGDGAVAWDSSSHPTSSRESYQGWLHLRAAGMLELEMNGAPDPSNLSVVNKNVPASKVSGAGFTFINLNVLGTGGGHVSQFYTNTPSPWPSNLAGNYFAFGTVNTASAIPYTSHSAIKVSEAYAIDFKFDDGVPNTGVILGPRVDAGRCIQVVNALTNSVAYNLSSTDNAECNMYFRY